MAVKVDAGKNCIRFHYSPTPLWCGIGVSAISILLTAIYLLAGRRSEKQKRGAVNHEGYPRKSDPVHRDPLL